MARISNVAVIGAGTMGHGIAQVAAAAGWTVVLHDVSPAFIENGLKAVRANLETGVARGKVAPEQRDATLVRLGGQADFDAAVREADLVVEAIPEDLGLKRGLFARLGERAPGHAILASNTSSLPIAALAEASGRPDRVVGMHFFNPVHIMKLVEVVRTDSAPPTTAVADGDSGSRPSMGKEPIDVRDAPGFASSRLGIAIGSRRCAWWSPGVASAEDIDKAMTLGYRHPMGPLRLTDLVGLDVRLAIAQYLHRELESEAFRPPEILERMVSEGKLGKKAGHGFYHWD